MKKNKCKKVKLVYQELTEFFEIIDYTDGTDTLWIMQLEKGCSRLFLFPVRYQFQPIVFRFLEMNIVHTTDCYITRNTI